jgi:hypothetical protein
VLKIVLLAGAAFVAALCFSSRAASADFTPQTLVLQDVPAATGPAVALFNGKDLDAWTGWLGYMDPAQTYRPDHGVPIGIGGKGDVFTVVTEDGSPALRVSGATWGSLIHSGDYSSYHLRLEYKWSGQRHPPRLRQPENNGLLYHSHGAPGAVWGTWSRAVEFEIMTGSVGMVVPVGDGLSVASAVAVDAAIIAPKQRFMAGAPEGKAVGGSTNWNIENNFNADRPVGQWNTLDLYVHGNRAIHVVNGVPVMEVWDICEPEGGSGPCVPLTHGAIQLQSEGAETFFRNIQLEPIDRLPVIETRATIPALTPVYLRIDAELSSKTSKNGDRFPIHVEEDVRVGESVVIPAGSPGEGEVIHAARSGAGGKAGELLITARFVRVGDQEIRLRSFSLGVKGRDRTNESLATSFVLGPFALAVVGGVITIPSGTMGGARTAMEVQVPVVTPASAPARQAPLDQEEE